MMLVSVPVSLSKFGVGVIPLPLGHLGTVSFRLSLRSGSGVVLWVDRVLYAAEPSHSVQKHIGILTGPTNDAFMIRRAGLPNLHGSSRHKYVLKV